jgi:hypothetical protein
LWPKFLKTNIELLFEGICSEKKPNSLEVVTKVVPSTYTEHPTIDSPFSSFT